LEEKPGWQTLLQAAQDFTTHVCEGLPYVLHCAKMREGMVQTIGRPSGQKADLAAEQREWNPLGDFTSDTRFAVA
jgi:hypothetical protein